MLIRDPRLGVYHEPKQGSCTDHPVPFWGSGKPLNCKLKQAAYMLVLPYDH